MGISSIGPVTAVPGLLKTVGQAGNGRPVSRTFGYLLAHQVRVVTVT